MKFVVNFRGTRSCVAETPEWFLKAPGVDQVKADRKSPLLQNYSLNLVFESCGVGGGHDLHFRCFGFSFGKFSPHPSSYTVSRLRQTPHCLLNAASCQEPKGHTDTRR